MNSSKLTEVFCRADVRPGVGLGHLVRLSALAQVASARFSCTLIVDSDGPDPRALGLDRYFSKMLVMPSGLSIAQEVQWIASKIVAQAIVVLDGYCFDDNYQRLIRSLGFPLVYIDDLAEGHYSADLVLNHAPGAENLCYQHSSHTQLCLGVAYRLVRKAFSCSSSRTSRIKSSLVICLGGSSQVSLIERLVMAGECVGFQSIHIVLGSAALRNDFSHAIFDRAKIHIALEEERLASLLGKASAAVLSASTVAMEAASLGLPFATGYFVGNQRFIYEGLTSAGAALPLDCLWDCSESEMKSQLEKLNSTEVQRSLVLAQQDLFREQAVHPLLPELISLSNSG